MTTLQIHPAEILAAAGELGEASRESQATLARVDKAMTALETKWAGASRQSFYKNYSDWRIAMGGIASLLKQVSREMILMAEEFQKADSTH